MVAEGNHKLDDVLPIYRRKTAAPSATSGTKDPSGGSGGAAGMGQTDRPIKYFVVDGVEALGKLGADAWCVNMALYHAALAKLYRLERDRVICVMTTGQAWQFKPYKWQDPTQLFHHGEIISFLSFLNKVMTPAAQLRGFM